MSSFSDIDYLFMDVDEVKKPLFPRAFQLQSLPAELRNFVYTESILEGFEAETLIKINAKGSIIRPKLGITCKQMQFEVGWVFDQYFSSALRNPSTPIYAQVKDCDYAPLKASIKALSEQHDIPFSELIMRTKVQLIGACDTGKLLSWAEDYREAGEVIPHTQQPWAAAEGNINYDGDIRLFEGAFALPTFLGLYSLFMATDNAHLWRGHCRNFLTNALLMGEEDAKLSHKAGTKEISAITFEILARWHWFLLKNLSQEKPKGRKAANRAEKARYLADALYGFRIALHRDHMTFPSVILVGRLF